MAIPQISERRIVDQREIEALYQRMEKPLYNVVYRWLWDPAEAQDVVQETFLRLWRARKSVRVATVEPLLYRTAINLARNRRRARRLWQWVVLDFGGNRRASDLPADEALAQEERESGLRRAVERLPEKLRSVLLLTEFSEMSYAEVATALRIPLGTVASRRNLALGRLGALAPNRKEGE